MKLPFSIVVVCVGPERSKGCAIDRQLELLRTGAPQPAATQHPLCHHRGGKRINAIVVGFRQQLREFRKQLRLRIGSRIYVYCK